MPSDPPPGNAHATLETAAGLATASVPVYTPDRRVGDLRREIAGQRYDCASHVVACDGTAFLGLVRIEDLLAAPADATLQTVIDRDPPVVGPDMDQEIAAWLAVSHGESALAVVDAQRRFIGLVPPRRLLQVLLSEHEEDLSHLGGFTRGAMQARVSSVEPVRRRFRHRLPWLLVGLGGALLAADLVGRFEAQLRTQVMLAFFIPGIVYLADAVGTQTETVVVRGLSVGVAFGRMARRELLAGLAIGLALAVVAGPVVWWRWADAELALSVGLAVFATCSTATVTAMALPWLFERSGLDPVFGSGPLATVIQDLLSILIYFAIVFAVMG
ncbi:magnesium transporter [Marilutibacter chinensis]|uniref:Magnesium transporter n=1 Tax=Marilutibacter chinensis TaxID=2912247 RepID=A0ABS9HMU9_9GAMM|nr:magnesium transporter [Lysobacter chinensis]MCF7220344.1 magnesium transporter [Lysobacter chinensis]